MQGGCIDPSAAPQSFECANGTLQLLLALKEHAALPDTAAEVR